MIALPLVATLALLLGTSPSPRTPYDALLAAQACRSSRELPEAQDCEFDLGSARFTVMWTRTSSPQVNLIHVDRDSPYRVAFLPRIGCVQVALAKVTSTPPVRAEDIVAFVSTATGEVHRTFGQCEDAQAKAR